LGDKDSERLGRQAIAIRTGPGLPLRVHFQTFWFEAVDDRYAQQAEVGTAKMVMRGLEPRIHKESCRIMPGNEPDEARMRRINSARVCGRRRRRRA
jgi:hypothetical protein